MGTSTRREIRRRATTYRLLQHTRFDAVSWVERRFTGSIGSAIDLIQTSLKGTTRRSTGDRVDIEYSGRVRSTEQPDVDKRRSCVEKTCWSRNLPRVPVRERHGAGCKNRDRQCAKGIGRFEIDHVFGIGEGCCIPAMWIQRRRYDLQ